MSKSASLVAREILDLGTEPGNPTLEECEDLAAMYLLARDALVWIKAADAAVPHWKLQEVASSALDESGAEAAVMSWATVRVGRLT